MAPRPGMTDPAQWMDWHINFADKHLFGYYGGGLFAQDEMQAAEIPTLASVRESLVRKTKGPCYLAWFVSLTHSAFRNAIHPKSAAA